jgi:hypothetical protein
LCNLSQLHDLNQDIEGPEGMGTHRMKPRLTFLFLKEEKFAQRVEEAQKIIAQESGKPRHATW